MEFGAQKFTYCVWLATKYQMGSENRQHYCIGKCLFPMRLTLVLSKTSKMKSFHWGQISLRTGRKVYVAHIFPIKNSLFVHFHATKQDLTLFCRFQQKSGSNDKILFWKSQRKSVSPIGINTFQCNNDGEQTHPHAIMFSIFTSHFVTDFANQTQKMSFYVPNFMSFQHFHVNKHGLKETVAQNDRDILPTQTT